MKLSDEVRRKLNQAKRWWAASSLVENETKDKTIELVRALLKEVGRVKLDEAYRDIEYLYYNGEFCRIVRIRELYVDEYDEVVAVLADLTEINLKDLDCLTDPSLWDGIVSSLD